MTMVFYEDAVASGLMTGSCRVIQIHPWPSHLVFLRWSAGSSLLHVRYLRKTIVSRCYATLGLGPGLSVCVLIGQMRWLARRGRSAMLPLPAAGYALLALQLRQKLESPRVSGQRRRRSVVHTQYVCHAQAVRAGCPSEATAMVLW
jgi:hypothetical protein